MTTFGIWIGLYFLLSTLSPATVGESASQLDPSTSPPVVATNLDLEE